jgi:osmotically inducible protein OsmC
MKRSAKAHWEGTGKEGKGHLTTDSTVLNQSQYSYSTRFENGVGTNPEELIAAAHAGCFNLKLSFLLTGAGHAAKALDTTCEITMESGSITQSLLILNANVPGIDAQVFEGLVNDAKLNCPISKLYNTTITLEYRLNN